MLGKHVGSALAGCSWVGVPFAGGLSEISHIKCSTLVINDLHRHVMNLARVLAHPQYGPRLIRRLRRMPFHPDVLEAAQRIAGNAEPGDTAEFVAAEAYFVSQWMGRSAMAGTDREFKGGLPVRWSATGGDSCVRFRSAVEALPEWRALLRRANFTTLDFRAFLQSCKDEPRHGIYCDPPFPGPGDAYLHKFTEADHITLAAWLAKFVNARVVVRYYDHPLVRDLYPESLWQWQELEGGRKQSNAEAPERLLVREGKAA